MRPARIHQAQQQMPFDEDQHPIGNFGPGDEHEPFRVSVARVVNEALSG
jgi:hypothetical protein